MAGYNFKNEKDVQEFLKNLFTEYSYGCYSEKNPEVCHLLGDYIETVKKNFTDAANIYKLNCDNFDFARSCCKIGSWKLIGKGCQKDMKQGFKYLQKSCRLNDTIGCTTAGIIAISIPEIHENDKNIILDEGVKVLEKSCYEQNSEKACFHLASAYIMGINGVLNRNFLHAYKLSLKACELGNYAACANIAQMHTKGEGALKCPKLAETFRERAEMLQKEAKDIKTQLKFGQGIPV